MHDRDNRTFSPRMRQHRAFAFPVALTAIEAFGLTEPRSAQDPDCVLMVRRYCVRISTPAG